ncbi:MAG: DEAD/DEAH box helicase [Deltaproteobacteria bacterium]|nr:DEAD/DEAH box helicase [Deltaproteobacteria bacterium]
MSTSRADIELAFYERFFFPNNLEPYPVQEQAFGHIFAGENVLVTVPTGTGKTLMAKAAIWKALTLAQTAVYTTPLRALTEEKFRELCADFGEEKVGFATGDYKVRPDAPVQVVVAEILWNRIYGDRGHAPADVVVMDEGHYFNDPERGHVWEQSIIGLDPRAQLIILSATVGDANGFCHWATLCRRQPMQLVESNERKVPLYHEFREETLLDTVRALQSAGDVPAIIFTFGRELCFERARLLKSCARFTTDAERARINELASPVLLDHGIAKDLKPLLLHGIGIHHAGLLPRYKELVERLTLERLLKFVVSTETISAGINLPAKRIVFPEVRKFVQGKARLLTPAEFHQMAGRAGRPQFDTEGIAIALAPEAVVLEIRREVRDAEKARFNFDIEKIRKSAYARARMEAQKNEDVTWDGAAHAKILSGQPAALRSQTRVTAEQILAIGLPDLAEESLPVAAADDSQEAPASPPYADLPPSLHLHIGSVIANLLLPEREKRMALKSLAQVTANLRAIGVVDEHGRQVAGEFINQLRGIDGLFVYFFLRHRDPTYELCRDLVEYLIDHDVIQKILDRKGNAERREWVRNRLRERRREEPHLTWDDIEAEYEREFPRELTEVERAHAEFSAAVPHPELHGGKRVKTVWTTMEVAELTFMDMVEREGLETEEGNLFSYLARVMKFSKMIFEATGVAEFKTLSETVRARLAVIDERVLGEL